MERAYVPILVAFLVLAGAAGLVLYSAWRGRGRGPWNDLTPEDDRAADVSLAAGQGATVAAAAAPAIVTAIMEGDDLDGLGPLGGGRSGGGGGGDIL